MNSEMESAIMDSIERIRGSGDVVRAIAALDRVSEHLGHMKMLDLFAAEYQSLLPQPDLAKMQAHLARYYASASNPEETFAGLVKEGVISENLGDTDKALELYAKARDAKPGDEAYVKAASLKSAKVLIRLGRNADAAVLLAPFVPSRVYKEINPDITFVLGLAYAAMEDIVHAQECFDALQSSTVPRHIQFLAILKLGDIYSESQNWERALEFYDEAFNKVEIYPDEGAELLGRFRSKVLATIPVSKNLGLLERMSETTTLLASVQSNPINYEIIARIALRMAEKNAVDSENALRAENDRAYQESLFKARDYFVKSAWNFMLARNADPSFLKSDFYLWQAGIAFYNGNHFSAAAVAFERYIGSDVPSNRPEAFHKLGLCYRNLGQYNEAIRVFDDNIALNPYTPPWGYMSHFEKANTLMLAGNLDLAEQAFMDILNDPIFTPQSPEWRLALFRLGETYYRRAMLGRDSRDRFLNDVAEALITLSEAVSRYKDEDPENSFVAYYYLARTNSLKGDWDKAIEMYRTAIDAGRKTNKDGVPVIAVPEYYDLNRNAYFSLADAYFTKGEFSRAADAYSTAWKRYSARPESMWATVQQVKCYYNLNMTYEAQRSLETAQGAAKRFLRENPELAREKEFASMVADITELAIALGMNE